jgi:acyl carrier protein
MLESSDVQERLQEYLLREVLASKDPAALPADKPLVTSGLLDSISTLQLVAFMEKEFSIEIEAHETGAENFDTLERITRLVMSKGPS